MWYVRKIYIVYGRKSKMSQKNDIPIFEQGTKEQKENKPTMKEAGDYFLEDNLKESVVCLLELCHELKVKINWYGKNSYRGTYKGKRVLLCNFIDKNQLRIGLSLADAHNKGELEKVLYILPNDLRTEYITNETKHCGRCMGSSCDFNFDFEEDGDIYRLCVHNAGYILYNPTPEKFKIVSQFIKLRVEYIDSTK